MFQTFHSSKYIEYYQMPLADRANQEPSQTEFEESSEGKQPRQVSGLRRLVYIFIAILCLILGILGILLPVLPTTPFLLLMSYFLVRSWPALNDRIVDLPVIGRPLRDWKEKGGVERNTKVVAYLMVTLVVIGTMISPELSRIVKISTLLLALCGVFVVWRLPIASQRFNTDDMPQNRQEFTTLK